MAVVLKPKRSEVASSVPVANDLAVGEIAINLVDKKIYSKNTGGTVVELASSGSVIQFPNDDTDLGVISATATQTSDLGDLGSNTFPDGTFDNLTVNNTFTQGNSTYYTQQYVLYGTTTNNTETEILIGGSARIPVPTDTTLLYEASIVARRTDATGESGSWHLKGCADNFSGTVADVGNVYEIAVAQDDVTLSVDVRADNTNDAINVFVTGASSKTIRWTAVVKTIEVAE